MVCRRCKMVVENVLTNSGLHPLSVELGEVLIEEDIDHDTRIALDNALNEFGFELIDDKKSRTIEKIKNAIVDYVHYSKENLRVNLSSYLSELLHQDYNYLSNLFSEVEGTTIEQYLILLRIEKVKELLVYDELTVSQIAHELNFSDASHLSKQFKKITGLTPGYFKQLKEKKRIPIEEL